MGKGPRQSRGNKSSRNTKPSPIGGTTDKPQIRKWSGNTGQPSRNIRKRKFQGNR